MAPVKDPHFLPEIWALFSLGSLWVVMRFAVRIRTFGIFGLGVDDSFAFIAVFCWAVIIAGINCTYYTATNIDYKPDEVWALTPEQIKGVEWGSKFYIITLYAYIVMVFSLKAIVIILYQRLAFGSWQKKLLRFTIVLCVCGFVATTLMLSLMCLPYSRRFEVQPLPDNECTASSTFFIALSCFNASTDALLLAIPVPLLWTLRIPLHKRILVFALLSSGIFVMGACITRVSLTVVPNITVRIIARWGARELSIALVAVNSASLRPMFRKSFWRPHKPALPQGHPRQKHNAYTFPSVQRAGQALKKGHYRNRGLNSTSVGQSTLERFAQSQASTMFGGPEEVPARPLPSYQVNPSRRQRLFSSLGSLGSNVMSSVARSRLMSRAVPSQGVDPAGVGADRGGTAENWAFDLEQGKRANEMVRSMTGDSGFPGFAHANSGFGVLPSPSTTIQSASPPI